MKRIFKLSAIACLMLIFLPSCSPADKESSPKATCAEDLKGHNVGCISGSLCDLYFSNFCPDAIKQVYNSPSDVIASLSMGKNDFIITDSIMVVGIDKNIHRVEAAFDIPEIGGNIGVAFRKQDTKLCNQFNEFLAQIKADGTYAEMYERWYTDNVNTSVIPEFETYTEGEPLRIGSMLGLPWCFIKNGEWAGFDSELMLRFASYLHRPAELKVFEFSSLMAALKTGVIDVWCSFVTINEERAKEVLFSDPYYFCPVVIFQRCDDSEVEKTPFYKRMKESFYNNLIIENRWKMLIDGLKETLIIALMSLLLGTLLGALICSLRMSENKVMIGFSKAYIEILRGVPMLVLLMVMFYVVLAPAGLSGRWVAIISFAINFSAYTCEIFRSGIQAIDRGQREAGLAMGFTPLKTFLLFILPQAAKNVLPVFKNEAISLLKGTSIVGYVAIQDLTKMSDAIRSRTFDAFFPLIMISIIYFLLAWLLGKALDLLTKKIS